MTGSGGGTANVNLPLGVRLNGPLSHFGEVEVGTTAARMDIKCSVNAALRIDNIGRAGMPPIFISDFTDVNISSANLNTNNAALALVHVQQDMTRNPAISQPPVGFRSMDNYYHSDHLWSLTFGDPAGGAGAHWENVILGPERNAGQVSVMAGRYKYIGAAGQSMSAVKIVSDHMVDLTGINLRYNNTIDLTDATYGGLKMNGVSYNFAQVSAPSTCGARIQLTMADGKNDVSIYWTDLSVRTGPPLRSFALAAGILTPTRPFFTVETEANAAAQNWTGINLPDGVAACGIEFTARAAVNVRVPTVVVGAGSRFVGPANVVLNNTNKTVTLIGESGVGAAAVFRVKSST